MSKSRPKYREISISKAELQTAFLSLYHNLKNYRTLLDSAYSGVNYDLEKISNLLPDQANMLEFGGVNVPAMEMIGAYLNFSLNLLKKDLIDFKLPIHPEDEFFKPDSELEKISLDISSLEKDLKSLVDKLFYLIDYVPISYQEKVRQVMRGISLFFKSIYRQDHDDLKTSIDHLHSVSGLHYVPTLINDIGKLTREIYDGLQEAQSLEGLDIDQELVDGMPDAITKINSAIERMESSANSTLDAVENLLDENSSEQGQFSSIVDKVSLIEEKLKNLQIQNTDTQSELNQLIQEIKDDIQPKISKRLEILKKEETIYLEIMSNQSFQDLSGQTLRKVVNFIERLEFNLVNLLSKHSVQIQSIPDSEGSKIKEDFFKGGPQNIKEATSQGDVDALLDQFGF